MEYWLKEAHVQKANLSLFLITISIDSVDLPCVWEMLFKKLDIKKLNMFILQKTPNPSSYLSKGIPVLVLLLSNLHG